MFYWLFWLSIILLFLFSQYRNNMFLMRLVNMLAILRNILPWLNFEDRKTFDDMANVVTFSKLQMLAIQSMLCVVIVQEKFYVQIPYCLICQLLMSYSQICLFIYKIGVENTLEFVLENKLRQTIQLTIQNHVIIYIISLTVICMMNQNKLILTQMQVAKLSMRVIINQLNEAIFVKSEDGHLCYSNHLGLKILDKTCIDIIENRKQRKRYLNRLSSMDFLTKNFFNQDQIKISNVKKRNDTLIMNKPFL